MGAITEGKLVWLPNDWQAVPKKATFEMLQSTGDAYILGGAYEAMLNAAPQLDTPLVLRWEGNLLMFNADWWASVTKVCDAEYGYQLVGRNHWVRIGSRQEARRAAERALGIKFAVEVL